ncbi:hypothetical protein H5410_038559 [Solanum commersonii]|uniref:Uncharacterized protein n=1 Tax=Solanum commersonii TaxID=4109 RepID=A0A9J5YBQ0_SOLCO|nr:hypothetical protein H5410_038559 [Solanum commersonii]
MMLANVMVMFVTANMMNSTSYNLSFEDMNITSKKLPIILFVKRSFNWLASKTSFSTSIPSDKKVKDEFNYYAPYSCREFIIVLSL